MIRRALQNGLLAALLIMLLFVKYLDWSAGWSAELPQYPITQASSAPR